MTTSHLYKTQNQVQRSVNNLFLLWDPMKIIKMCLKLYKIVKQPVIYQRCVRYYTTVVVAI